MVVLTDCDLFHFSWNLYYLKVRAMINFAVLLLIMAIGALGIWATRKEDS